MMPVVTQIVHTLLEEWEALLEDRIDDLLKQYAHLEWGRGDIENLVRYDPSRNKKYLAWIVKQVAKHSLDEHELDALHDGLMEFERLLTLPAFQDNRDLYTYDLPIFQQMIAANMELRSRSEIDRKARAAKKRGPAAVAPATGVEKVATHGNLDLLRITEAEALSWWAWQAYKKENPNWNRPTIHPPPPGTDPHDHDGKWCVRNPTHGSNYLRKEPFFLVLLYGWPYVGILLKQGQAKDLDNKRITMGVAEEIYPILSPFISAMKEDGDSLDWECKIFENMRFLHGEVEPGESFGSDVDLEGSFDLEGSSLASIPANLRFLQGLDVSRTQLTEIPDGIHVQGDLKANDTPIAKIGADLQVSGVLNLSGTAITEIPAGLNPKTLNLANTKITSLPDNLSVEMLNIEGTLIKTLPVTLRAERMTWSEPLTLNECKLLFMRNNMPILEREFMSHPNLANSSKSAANKKWKAFQPTLTKFYLTNETVEGHVLAMFIHKKPATNESRGEPERVVTTAMKHKRTGLIGIGSTHSEAMEDLVRRLNHANVWPFSWEELEEMPDNRRNRYWGQVEHGFWTNTQRFISKQEADKMSGQQDLHGEDIPSLYSRA